MLMYAKEVKAKEKEKLPEIKKNNNKAQLHQFKNLKKWIGTSFLRIVNYHRFCFLFFENQQVTLAVWIQELCLRTVCYSLWAISDI